MKRLNLQNAKKGFTLVELVVTVGILSIVSGLGIGIVASAIKNYGTASTTSKEQDTSLMVERFVVEGIRSAANIMDWEDTGALDDKNSARYLYFKDNKLYTVNNIVDIDGVVSTIEVSYEGVKSIALTVKKCKPKLGAETDPRCFMYVSYEIEMDWGYVLSGSTVMNNADIKKYKMDDTQSEQYTNVNFTLWICSDPDVESIQADDSKGNTKCTSLMIQAK